MKRRLTIATFLFAAWSCGPAMAGWTGISRGLDETEVGVVAVHPKDPATVFAASRGRLYKTENAGDSWKRVLSVRGREAAVRCLWIDGDGTSVYAGSDKGLYRSLDGGKKWASSFKGGTGPSASVQCLAQPQDPATLWFGTGAGLFSMDKKTEEIRRISAIGETSVYSIAVTAEAAAALTEKGIFRSLDGGSSWQKVYTDRPGEEGEAEESLEHFDLEELSLPPNFSEVIFFAPSGNYYAAGRRGLVESASDAGAWSLQAGQTLPSREVRALTASPGTFYAATERGVFAFDRETASYKDLSDGLLSPRVNDVAYSAAGDYLVAATAEGVYRLSHPDLTIAPRSAELPLPVPDAREFLSRFQSEPSILEIQGAAIRYAEVHPEKIEAWRRAASRKALLPTLSLDADTDSGENVDLDRGGTADPDRFITGPEEKSSGWSFGVSWNLGELIWNDDQTSIDTRSRLMVQLRDDVLNEVTHLYFERRRLQAASAMSPAKDLPLEVENELRLQELTAKIDALTGGYLSDRLHHKKEGSS